MRTALDILLWPLAAAVRLWLEVLIWFRPNIARRRCVFPASIHRLIEPATVVEVHYAELGSGEPPEPGQIGAPMGFISLGMVRLESPREVRRVIRSVLKANRECLGGLLCLDAEYGLRFESELGRAELTICFRCMQVWVKADAEGAGRFYPISGRPQALLATRSFTRRVSPQPPPRKKVCAESGSMVPVSRRPLLTHEITQAGPKRSRQWTAGGIGDFLEGRPIRL
ncbi:MAG TPA: hypothetical protein VH092_25890 [Urbifossiella sp.]|jgi:hypothetical protein|nr:hypothetical protein [Urbifossiella sp.]